MLQAGSLNSRVSILTPSTSQDAIGQRVPTWDTLGGAWANIRHLSGTAAIKASGDATVVQASIRLRYRTDITPAMRVLHAGTAYNIKAVLPDTVGKEHIDLVCEVAK